MKRLVILGAGGYGRTYIIGYLPNCFVTWSKDIKEGIYIYNKNCYSLLYILNVLLLISSSN